MASALREPTGIISLTHVYKSAPNQRLHKPYRIALRFAVAIVILLLPLADSLNSLDLIATTTCLVVVVLAFELAGSTCTHDSFWWDRSKKRKCTYSARCNIPRKELEASVRAGQVINVEEIARRRSDEKSNYELQY